MVAFRIVAVLMAIGTLSPDVAHSETQEFTGMVTKRIEYLTVWYSKWLATIEWKKVYPANKLVEVTGVWVKARADSPNSHSYVAAFAAEAKLTFRLYLDGNQSLTKYHDAVSSRDFSSNAEAVREYLSSIDVSTASVARRLSESDDGPTRAVPPEKASTRSLTTADIWRGRSAGLDNAAEDSVSATDQYEVFTFSFHLPTVDDAGSIFGNPTDLDQLSQVATSDITSRGWINACSGPATLRIPKFGTDDPQVYGLIEDTTCGAVLDLRRSESGRWKLQKYYAFDGSGKWLPLAEKIRQRAWSTIRLR